MPAKAVPGVSGQGHGSHEVCVGDQPCTSLDSSQHTPVPGSLAVETSSRRWLSASRLSPRDSSSLTTSPLPGVATRQGEALMEGTSARWRCANDGGLVTTVGRRWWWKSRVTRGGASWRKETLDDEVVEVSRHLPVPHPQHCDHLPCGKLDKVNVITSRDRIVSCRCLKAFPHLNCSIWRIFARVLLRVNTAATAMVPTMMMSTPRIADELAEPTD